MMDQPADAKRGEAGPEFGEEPRQPELLAWAALLAGLLGAAFLVGTWAPDHPDSIWIVPVVATPLLPIVGLAWRFASRLSRADELRGKIVRDALAFAFVASSMAAGVYALLEEVALPRLRAWWVWIALMGFWAVGWTLSQRRYR